MASSLPLGSLPDDAFRVFQHIDGSMFKIRDELQKVKQDMDKMDLKEPHPLLPCRLLNVDYKRDGNAISVKCGLRGKSRSGACHIIIKEIKEKKSGARKVLFDFLGDIVDGVPSGKFDCKATVLNDQTQEMEKISAQGDMYSAGAVGKCSYVNETQKFECNGNFWSNEIRGKGYLKSTLRGLWCYEGQIRANRPHGLGSLNWKGEQDVPTSSYFGNFQDGLFHGLGVLTSAAEHYQLTASFDHGRVSKGPCSFERYGPNHTKMLIQCLLNEEGQCDRDKIGFNYVYDYDLDKWRLFSVHENSMKKCVFQLVLEDLICGSVQRDNFSPNADIPTLYIPDEIEDQVYVYRDTTTSMCFMNSVHFTGNFTTSNITGYGSADGSFLLPNYKHFGFFVNGDLCGHGTVTDPSNTYRLRGSFASGNMVGNFEFKPIDDDAWYYEGSLWALRQNGASQPTIHFHGHGTLTYRLDDNCKSSFGKKITVAKLSGNWYKGRLSFAYWRVFHEDETVDGTSFYAGFCSESENIQEQFMKKDPTNHGKFLSYLSCRMVPTLADGFGICSMNGNVFQGMFKNGNPLFGSLMRGVETQDLLTMNFSSNTTRAWPQSKKMAPLAYFSFAVFYDCHDLAIKQSGFHMLDETPTNWCAIRKVDETFLRKSEPMNRIESDHHWCWKFILDIIVCCANNSPQHFKRARSMHSEFLDVALCKVIGQVNLGAYAEFRDMPYWKELFDFSEKLSNPTPQWTGALKRKAQVSIASSPAKRGSNAAAYSSFGGPASNFSGVSASSIPGGSGPGRSGGSGSPASGGSGTAASGGSGSARSGGSGSAACGMSPSPQDIITGSFFKIQDAITKKPSAKLAAVLKRIEQGQNLTVQWMWNNSQDENYVRVFDEFAIFLEQHYTKNVSTCKYFSEETLYNICFDTFTVEFNKLGAPDHKTKAKLRRDEGHLLKQAYAQDIIRFWDQTNVLGEAPGLLVKFSLFDTSNPLQMSQVEEALRRNTPWSPSNFRFNVNIEKVWRVMNINLLEQFLLKAQQIERVRGGWSNIMRLWHGTARTSPYTILQHNFAALDHMCSRDSGLFYGPGIYFSFELPYISWNNHSYAYRSDDIEGNIPNKHGEYYHVLLCHVALGNAIDKTNVMDNDKWKISATKPFPGKELLCGQAKEELIQEFVKDPNKKEYKLTPALSTLLKSEGLKCNGCEGVSQQTFIKLDVSDFNDSSALNKFQLLCANDSKSLFMIPSTPARDHLRLHKDITYIEMTKNVLSSKFDSVVSGPHRTLAGGIHCDASLYGNAGSVAVVYNRDQILADCIVVFRMIDGQLSVVSVQGGS